MAPGARTPEELDGMLEDAFVVRDPRAVTELFESEALLVDDGAREARGAREIAYWAAEAWSRGLTYVGAEPRVLQARDTALVLTRRGIAVARRDQDRAWHYAITLLATEHRRTKEEP
jgi:hypothetical protein